MITSLLLVFCGHLCGSLTTPALVCRLLGLADPHREGSGNPGTTDVYRLFGFKAGLLTFIGDLGKGVLPVIVAGILHTQNGFVAVTGLAAFKRYSYRPECRLFHFRLLR